MHATAATSVREALRDAAIAAFASFVVALPVLAPMLGALDAPWGSGDLIAHYMSASIWAPLGFPVSTRFGFPGGMNLAYVPTIDITQFGFAWLVGAVTGSPYTGFNLLLVLSFPLTAALTVVALRLVGARGPIAIALAVAFTLIPYHFDRGLSHISLATMYAAVTGVILALIVGSGRTPTATRPVFVGTIVLVVVTAWSGMYYAAFGIILTAAAVIWRWIQGDAARSLLRSALVPVGIAVLALAAFAPGAIRLLTDPPLINLVERPPADSVTFAGNLALLITPFTDLQFLSRLSSTMEDSLAIVGVGAENPIGNSGTWVTTLALLVFLVGWGWLHRARVSRAPLPFLGYLTITALIFFIPWGAGYLFASTVSAQVRAWGRLTPILLLLFILGAAAVLARTRLADERSWGSIGAPVVALLIVLVVLTTQVLPFRATYAQAAETGRALRTELTQYATAVNTAVPQRCGVLQLPYMAYPENGIREPGLNDYEHGWHGLTNKGKFFSYGAVKGTDASVVTASLTDPPSRSQLEDLRALGFCAIHLDKRGYTDAAWQRVTAMLGADLGPPIAEGLDGAWLTYRL